MLLFTKIYIKVSKRAIQCIKFYLYLPATEHQKRHNPHENQERQHFQQQGDGAGIPCVASPEMLENTINVEIKIIAREQERKPVASREKNSINNSKDYGLADEMR